MKKQGHISDHMSLLNIAKKHNVTDSELRSELKKGIKVEQEHTSNVKAAARIALDHLFEDPKYYTKLAKIKLENNILNEYSDKIINQLIDKFKQEKPNLSPNIIQSYIERFSQIKDSPEVSEKDILKYDWKKLETTVDSNQPKRIKAGKINDGEPGSDANLIYNQNKLRIYLGKDKRACIKYGNGYNFCISARGEESMYDYYRIQEQGTPYFIFDDTKTSERDEQGNFIDPTHLLVLFIYSVEDEYGAESQHYTITTADNPGDKEYYNEPWENAFEQIEKDFPRLRGLQKVFEPAHPDESEIKKYKLDQEYTNKLIKINTAYEKNYGNKFIYGYNTGDIISANQKIDKLINNKVPVYFFTAELKPTANEDEFISSIIRQYRYGDLEKEKKGFIENILIPAYEGPGNAKDSVKEWNITYEEQDFTGKMYQSYFKEIKEVVDEYRNKLSQLNLVKENQSLKDKSPLNKELVKEFMKHVMNELRLDSLPKIKLSNDSQEAVEHGSWGGYNTGDQSIRIVTAKRHPADIFRTLAHELVHYKQDLTGRLQAGDGKTGSDVENEANSRAAIIMRNFAEAKPSLFEHLITELSYGLENALPDDEITYIGGKDNEYIFSTYKDGKKLNDYKVAFKPDGESTYERVYHTTNRPLGTNFEDTKEGIITAIKVNATVMKITLDFMKRNPNFTMIYIVPISRSRFTAVKKFIENNLPSNYSFEAESNDKGEDIIAIYNKPEL